MSIVVLLLSSSPTSYTHTHSRNSLSQSPLPQISRLTTIRGREIDALHLLVTQASGLFSCAYWLSHMLTENNLVIIPKWVCAYCPVTAIIIIHCLLHKKMELGDKKVFCV
jgi:hypothetical protein